MTHRHVDNAVRSIDCCYRDRQLIQHARCVITKSEDYVLRNLHVICYGIHVRYEFFSGSNPNKRVFVVEFNGEDEIQQEWKNKGFRMWLSDTISSIWEGVKSFAGGLFGSAFGALTGSGMKALLA